MGAAARFVSSRLRGIEQGIERTEELGGDTVRAGDRHGCGAGGQGERLGQSARGSNYSDWKE
jgi:hypothetical protein